MTARQRTTLLTLPALLLAAMVVPMAMAWSELPDSMATHWDLGGTPNGHMPPLVLLALLAGVFAAMWSAVWWSARRMPFEARSFITGLVAVGGLLAAVLWFSVDANRGVADWSDAGQITVVHLVIVFVVATALGVLGWFLAGAAAVGDTERAAAGPMMELEPGTTPVWASRGRGIFIVAIGVVLVAVAIAIWSVTSVVLLVVSIPVLLFSEVKVTIANRGVVVSLGWLGIPSWTVPLETIEGADVEDVRPMAYGGWGYRVRTSTRAIVVRAGEGLRLRRFDRPDLVLTVDDAERGAALVNALVSRSRT